MNHGLLGTLDRILLGCALIKIHNDVLYIPDSNYMFDNSAIVAVDTKKLLSSHQKGPYATDPAAYVYVKNAEELYDGDFQKDIQHYLEFMKEMEWHNSFMSKNNFAFEKEPEVVRTWQYCPIAESSVKKVWFENDRIKAVCGSGGKYRELTIKGTEVVTIKETGFSPEEKEIPECLKGLDYPYIPGRQYKAVPEIAAKIWDGKYIVATKDGMICVVNGGDVTSFGTAIQTCSPVNGFAVCMKKRVVYGIAGGSNDCGIIFSYDDKKGVRQLGRTFFNQFRKPGVACSNELSSIAVSEQEDRLVIGGMDRLGCVWVYEI